MRCANKHGSKCSELISNQIGVEWNSLWAQDVLQLLPKCWKEEGVISGDSLRMHILSVVVLVLVGTLTSCCVLDSFVDRCVSEKDSIMALKGLATASCVRCGSGCHNSTPLSPLSPYGESNELWKRIFGGLLLH